MDGLLALHTQLSMFSLVFRDQQQSISSSSVFRCSLVHSPRAFVHLLMKCVLYYGCASIFCTPSCDMKLSDMEEGSQEHHWAISARSSMFSTCHPDIKPHRHKTFLKCPGKSSWNGEQREVQCLSRRRETCLTVPSCLSVKEAIIASFVSSTLGKPIK